AYANSGAFRRAFWVVISSNSLLRLSVPVRDRDCTYWVTNPRNVSCRTGGISFHTRKNHTENRDKTGHTEHVCHHFIGCMGDLVQALPVELCEDGWRNDVLPILRPNGKQLCNDDIFQRSRVKIDYLTVNRQFLQTALVIVSKIAAVRLHITVDIVIVQQRPKLRRH